MMLMSNSSKLKLERLGLRPEEEAAQHTLVQQHLHIEHAFQRADHRDLLPQRPSCCVSSVSTDDLVGAGGHRDERQRLQPLERPSRSRADRP